MQHSLWTAKGDPTPDPSLIRAILCIGAITWPCYCDPGEASALNTGGWFRRPSVVETVWTQLRKRIAIPHFTLTHPLLSILSGTKLLNDEDGAPIEFSAAGEPTFIRVRLFYRLVEAAWERFDRTLINPAVKREFQKRIVDPADFASTNQPIASSGAPFDPIIQKL
jgi:hypothetical protein